MRRISHSWQKGDFATTIAASTALIGNGLQIGGSGYVSYHGGRLAVAAAQRQIIWITEAEKTLGFVARTNPWLLATSVMILVGEIDYNFVQSSALVNWICQSSWGKNGL